MRRPGLVASVLVLVGTLLGVGESGAQARPPVPADADAGVGADGTVGPLQIGLATPDGLDAAQLPDVRAELGTTPDSLVTYADFATAPPVTEVARLARSGVRAIVTWEPWRWGASDQSAYSPAAIAAGRQDAYLLDWAHGFADAGVPVTLRFAHEMNGTWYPWSGTPSAYVKAWRHVHDLFAAVGTDVTWIWSPNVPYPGSGSMAASWPGAAYVDVVALDGYNWGTTTADSTWQSPSALFGPGLTALRRIAPGLPIIIGETASTEQGGSKPAWIRSLVSYLSAQDDVAGVVWFDFDKETDWRVTSSPAATTAMRQALATRRR